MDLVFQNHTNAFTKRVDGKALMKEWKDSADRIAHGYDEYLDYKSFWHR